MSILSRHLHHNEKFQSFPIYLQEVLLKKKETGCFKESDTLKMYGRYRECNVNEKMMANQRPRFRLRCDQLQSRS